MKTLKIKFDHLYPGFNPLDNHFSRLLSKRFKVEICDDPDFYFFMKSYYGTENYLKYKCHRIFWGGENERANWNICDYVLDFDFYANNPRHLRYPLWATWNPTRLTQPKNVIEFLNKKKFCCMVVSNGNAKERIDFFNRLSKYKKVDSGGRFLNNIGSPVKDKMDFIKDYKFVLSFENSSYPGYTTEKLIEPMIVNSIPIYWGNPVVGNDFNVNSFINVESISSFDEAIERIIEVDKNDEKYLELINQPWFNNNQIPKEVDNESLLNFFDFILADSKTKKPVAQSVVKRNIHQIKRYKTKVLFRLNQLNKLFTSN
jgi:hypothetical protein